MFHITQAQTLSGLIHPIPLIPLIIHPELEIDGMENYQSIEVTFDQKVFGVETIKKALYKFSDKCSFDITIDVNNQINVVIYPSIESTDNLIHKIRNEVIDQDLRATIAEETHYIRTLILANAFSRTEAAEK